MSLLRVVACSALLVPLVNTPAALNAQSTAEPTAYTVTSTNTLFGPPSTTHVYRLGSKVLVESDTSPSAELPKGIHVRTFYDLKAMKSVTVDMGEGAAPCSTAALSGDWGDPFEGASALTDPNGKHVGTETIHGYPTEIVEASAGSEGTMKAWVDPKTGLIVKALMIPTDGSAPKTLVEVTSVSMDPPPASIFEIPARCAAAPAPAPAAAATTSSGPPKEFVEAIYPPESGSPNSCTVLFRVVEAGTMEPVTGRFQVALDPVVDGANMPSYNISTDIHGHTTFSGGNLHDVSAQVRNGELRIENPGKAFKLYVDFGTPGESDALLYRQCFGPETVLLLELKNPASVMAGTQWMWVTSGKYAAGSH